MSLVAKGVYRRSEYHWLSNNINDECAVSVVSMVGENRNNFVFFGDRLWLRLPIFLWPAGGSETVATIPAAFFNGYSMLFANDSAGRIFYSPGKAEGKHFGLCNRAHIGHHAEVGHRHCTMVGNGTLPIAGAGG